MPIDPVYLDKRGAAQFCSLSIRRIDYARESGDLPFYRIGRKVLYRVGDLEAWLDRFRIDPTELDAADAH